MVIHTGFPNLRGFNMYGRSADLLVGPRTPSCWNLPCAFPERQYLAFYMYITDCYIAGNFFQTARCH